VFQKELCDGVSNLIVWRVLRKHLHLKANEDLLLDKPLHVIQNHSKLAYGI
jgi:hypothetical protein